VLKSIIATYDRIVVTGSFLFPAGSSCLRSSILNLFSRPYPPAARTHRNKDTQITMGGSLSLYQKFEATVESQAGKTIVITGCTSGTGLVLAGTARRKGANVVMLNRKSPRAEAAFSAIEAIEGSGKVTHIDCDLTTFESVRAAAEKVKAECADGVDVLCNNAGIMAFPDDATSDGYDIQMQVNHISHFLLTKELYPLLEKKAEATGDARIVNHSSIARYGSPLEEKYFGKNGGNLGGNEGSAVKFNGPRFERYHQTKLANMVFTSALVEKLAAKGSKVKALVAHPGVAKTSLAVTMGTTGVSIPSILGPLLSFVFQSAEDGTLGIGRCCLQAGVESGEFYGPAGGEKAMKGEAVKLDFGPANICSGDEAKKMLWEKSSEAVGEFILV
jgi:NAD(P)-dependent dehydrogenase (short-subunit alcohol dehydrogenase family)